MRSRAAEAGASAVRPAAKSPLRGCLSLRPGSELVEAFGPRVVQAAATARYDVADQRASTHSLLARDGTKHVTSANPMCPQHGAHGRPRLPCAPFISPPGEERSSSLGRGTLWRWLHQVAARARRSLPRRFSARSRRRTPRRLAARSFAGRSSSVSSRRRPGADHDLVPLADGGSAPRRPGCRLDRAPSIPGRRDSGRAALPRRVRLRRRSRERESQEQGAAEGDRGAPGERPPPDGARRGGPAMAQLLHFVQGRTFPSGYDAVNTSALSPAAARSRTRSWSIAGSAEGVRIDSPVVNGVGLVGIVSNVFPHTATVTLLSDPDEAVAALDPQHRCPRVGPHGDGRDPDPRPGQQTVHGQGRRQARHRRRRTPRRYPDLYPYGIPIGTVTSVNAADTVDVPPGAGAAVREPRRGLRCRGARPKKQHR